MNNFKPFIVLIIILFLTNSSCSKQGYSPHTEQVVSELFYIKGQVKGVDESAFKAFRFETGDNTDSLDHVFWRNTIVETGLGASLISGLYTPDVFIAYAGSVFAGFQFWAADLPDNRQWTKEELELFFEIGTVFEAGQGNGKVDFQYQWSNGEYRDLAPSKASYLIQPEGLLTITSIQDIDYPSIGINNTPLHRFGKRISCTFSCKLGRFEPHGGSVFFTDKVIEITQGEAVFFVDYRN